MGRRFAACAALLALMVTLSACCCNGGVVAPTAAAAGAKKSMVVAAPAKVAVAPAPPKAPCTRYVDRSDCYASEADRDMGRLRDDLPPGGSCAKAADGMGGDGHKCGSGCGGCPKCGH